MFVPCCKVCRPEEQLIFQKNRKVTTKVEIMFECFGGLVDSNIWQVSPHYQFNLFKFSQAIHDLSNPNIRLEILKFDRNIIYGETPLIKLFTSSDFNIVNKDDICGYR